MHEDKHTHNGLVYKIKRTIRDYTFVLERNEYCFYKSLLMPEEILNSIHCIFSGVVVKQLFAHKNIPTETQHVDKNEISKKKEIVFLDSNRYIAYNVSFHNIIVSN